MRPADKNMMRTRKSLRDNKMDQLRHFIKTDKIGKNKTYYLDRQENVLCPNCKKKTYTLIDTDNGLLGKCKSCKYTATYD